MRSCQMALETRHPPTPALQTLGVCVQGPGLGLGEGPGFWSLSPWGDFSGQMAPTKIRTPVARVHRSAVLRPWGGEASCSPKV